MISSLGLSLIFFIVVIFLVQYHWKRRHIYRLARKLPGPPALPIIGNGLLFLCDDNDILKKIREVTGGYTTPLRFWFGPTLMVYFSNPHHLEKILSSSKVACKPSLFKILKIYIGDGLVSNSGPKYKLHRRLIQPLFNLKFSSGNIEVFQKHINVLLALLDQHANGKDSINIHEFIHCCLADIIGETIQGMQMKAQQGGHFEYRKASANVYSVCHSRFMRPWLHLDAIYRLTEGQKLQNDVVKVTTEYIQKNIDEAVERTKRRSAEEKQNVIGNPDVPIIDQIAEMIDKDPNLINDRDFLYHMFTLYLASEDTMTMVSAFLCMCLGMYPEYQQIAAEEIRTIFGETPREVTHDDILKLNYLDMCIREVLRLIPIAPLIVRETTEDYTIDNLTIPKGCMIVVSIYDVHRNPEYWENPDHFHPDHFLPENVKKRHPFAFIPYSAGPRGCIGKVFSLIGIKSLMANILQRFEIEADGKFPDVVLKSDITIRSASGYDIRLKRRVWT